MQQQQYQQMQKDAVTSPEFGAVVIPKTDPKGYLDSHDQPSSNKLKQILITIFFITAICVQITWTTCYHIYDHNHKYKTAQYIYFACSGINITISSGVMLLSIYLQHHTLHKYKPHSDLSQSFRVNLILLFFAALYFSTIGALGFVKPDLLSLSLYHFAMDFGLLLVGAHFIGNLKWGWVSNSGNYSMYSPNWWCCVYLIFRFFGLLEFAVVSPWVGYHDFLKTNNDMEQVTGQFVHVMIMYACRPALTIVAFRCIEQIMHQITHHNHDKSVVSSDVNRHNVSIQGRSASGNSDVRLIEFHSVTTTECIIFAPFVLIVVVFDLMTLSIDSDAISSKIDYMVWGMVFGIQIIWSAYVIYVIKRVHTNKLDVPHIINKHFGLFISASGLMVALAGIIGERWDIWEVWVTYIVDFGYIVTQCWVLILLHEAKMNCHDFDRMGWKMTTFGKVVFIFHLMLIIHGFLDEGYHLEETMAESTDHDEEDVWSALEFIFFFWSIEFHLACIERINFANK
eukprot:89737_1